MNMLFFPAIIICAALARAFYAASAAGLFQ
jgi:hypothetical protein